MEIGSWFGAFRIQKGSKGAVGDTVRASLFLRGMAVLPSWVSREAERLKNTWECLQIGGAFLDGIKRRPTAILERLANVAFHRALNDQLNGPKSFPEAAKEEFSQLSHTVDIIPILNEALDARNSPAAKPYQKRSEAPASLPPGSTPRGGFAK